MFARMAFIEIGETPEEAVIRETREEFGINVANIIPVALISGMSEQSDVEMDGGPGSGRYPKGSGEKGKKSNQKKSSNESKKEKQKKGSQSQSQKKELNNSENSGIIYAGRKISSYIANPKTLGDTTHKEKYDDFKSHGVDVKPLGKGSHKGKSYEDGGGYKINDGEDGVLTYHPAKGSHHKGEYYKVATG